MKNLIKISVLFTFIFGHHIVEAQQNLAQQAYLILEQRCFDCHGPDGAFTENLVIESASQLVATGAVVKGKPMESELYRRLRDKNPAKRMPLGQPQLSAAAIGTIDKWIQAGAPSWDVERDVDFITIDAMLNTIRKHVQSLPRFDRASARYFTTTHLYNAGESPETLRAYQLALSKLVNSLSWGSEIVKPEPINGKKTIFYIDLRRYEWDRNDAWTQIEQEYPYSFEFDSGTQAGLSSTLTLLRREMDCEVPFVYADWFLATASLPPLYHDILDLPETERELERRLQIDVQRNLQSAPGVRVWRAGFNDSGVSKNNRVVERHTSQHGAYWKSYDFAGSVGAQNIFTHPLTFRHDGGEIVFNLPNGLQGYYISDASGSRIDEAPTEIVSNPDERDGIVRNGISCIGCHTEGMKKFEDDVRDVIEKMPESPAKVQALRLYVTQAEMNGYVREDTTTYRRALEDTGGVFGGIEPVYRFYKAFENPLNAAHAAAAVGLETETLIAKIRAQPSLQNLGLRTLESRNGNVKRDAWTSNFSEVLAVLNSPDRRTPIDDEEEDDIDPRDIVSIPDVNLRAAVESALGKPAGALITGADMEKLERLVADEKGISDLRGLEYATHLERIELRHNAISDLSPLRGLTRLNNIKLRGNRITDISPLADLDTNDIGWLGLEENAITDLSPLRGLVKLREIGLDGNPVSDVSPLAGLLSLEGISARDTAISDLSPLASVPRLRWLQISDNSSLSNLTSLKGLKTLRRLEIHHCGISDISGLSGLTQLRELSLEDNLITDISPLAKLTNLTRLDLRNNVIRDVSPLAGLNKLEQLNLWENAISDLSPLKGLFGKASINLGRNPGLSHGGPKITGPWVWMLFPGADFDAFEKGDLLAAASGGKVTERRIAANGAVEGESVGKNSWISGKIATTGWDNIGTALKSLGTPPTEDAQNVVYGSIILESPRQQKTDMFVGTHTSSKIWLNGEMIEEDYHTYNGDYERFFPVTLKKGKNIVLVSIHNWHADIAGHFGFAPDVEYRVVSTSEPFSLSTQATSIGVNKTFTLQLKANDITDLAGWQADLVFDPDVLKVDSVTEGTFLKQKGGRTHFRKGTVNNQKGKIAGISSTRISPSGVTGEGGLLSVKFTAKATGETRVSLREFRAGSSAGKTILVTAPDVIITVGAQSTPAPTPTTGDKGFSLSTNTTPVPVGNTFTLRLSAEKIVDLAGWQTDITFDPAMLEAVQVNEGDFLKKGGIGTFFLRGTIDNTVGKITKINAARLSGGVDGTGTLLSVTFKAKAVGDTRITLSNLTAGNSSTEAIPLAVPDIVITIGAAAFPVWDVNQDGQVNVLDLIGVAQHLGTTASANRQADVNGDGTINVLDLIAVAQHLGESTTSASPSILAMDNITGLNPAMIQAWIERAQLEDDGSIAFRQGIANLELLLALFVPEETALLHNYPNPFNPETWIPYQLAEPAEVTFRIYATSGVLIRTLALGYQPAGIYQYRSRAAYWDGKNEVGESVASGVYFYTLTAGNFTATGKMLIRK